MKKLHFNTLNLLVIFGLIFTSCTTSTNTSMKKSISGRPGEMVVVISKDSWESGSGEIIRNTLGQAQTALPQEEPLFNLIDVPQEAFKDIFKSTRNIVTTKISPSVEKSGIRFRNDVWAYPQATMQIHAKNSDEFIKLVSDNSSKIISYFLKAERERLTTTYKKIHEKVVVNKLAAHGIEMYSPPGFTVAEEKKDFIWFRYETPEISQGIFVYWFDYTSDSMFTSDFLLAKRNALLKKHVPGPTDGSYMISEPLIDPVLNIFEHNGNYAAEMRGLWKVENDFMGGPYLSIAELDASRQRVVVADGYVYAPSKDKRNLLRQVEAMIYSMKFKEQEKNDKINSQVKMGN